MRCRPPFASSAMMRISMGSLQGRI